MDHSDIKIYGALIRTKFPTIVTHILQKAFWGHALTQPKQAPPGAICFYHLKHIALRGFFYLGIFLYAFLKEGKKRNIEL